MHGKEARNEGMEGSNCGERRKEVKMVVRGNERKVVEGTEGREMGGRKKRIKRGKERGMGKREMELERTLGKEEKGYQYARYGWDDGVLYIVGKCQPKFVRYQEHKNFPIKTEFFFLPSYRNRKGCLEWKEAEQNTKKWSGCESHAWSQSKW